MRSTASSNVNLTLLLFEVRITKLVGSIGNYVGDQIVLYGRVERKEKC
jgi:hypothetical protein